MATLGSSRLLTWLQAVHRSQRGCGGVDSHRPAVLLQFAALCVPEPMVALTNLASTMMCWQATYDETHLVVTQYTKDTDDRFLSCAHFDDEDEADPRMVFCPPGNASSGEELVKEASEFPSARPHKTLLAERPTCFTPSRPHSEEGVMGGPESDDQFGFLPVTSPFPEIYSLTCGCAHPVADDELLVRQGSARPVNREEAIPFELCGIGLDGSQAILGKVLPSGPPEVPLPSTDRAPAREAAAGRSTTEREWRRGKEAWLKQRAAWLRVPLPDLEGNTLQDVLYKRRRAIRRAERVRTRSLRSDARPQEDSCSSGSESEDGLSEGEVEAVQNAMSSRNFIGMPIAKNTAPAFSRPLPLKEVVRQAVLLWKEEGEASNL